MKKIILLVSVVLFGCVGYAQAQTSEKKLSRQERKEAKRAMEQALFEEAKQAIENKSFTLEADQVIFKRGRTAFVSSNTNFVTVNGNKGSVQVAFNIPVSGPNGLGGVTVDGNVSGYKVTTDKKGNIRLAMNITGVGISAQVNISLANGGNNATVDIYNPQIQISAESETKRSIFREKDKTKRSKKESAQHSKSRNKSFVMTSVSAL